MTEIEFLPFPKLARLSRDMVITEKLDGTNAQIYITDDDQFLVGSRKRWITPEDDNFGFARWAHEHEDELRVGLGYGQHFGEWWGRGIQRGYGLDEKRFSLFNVGLWDDPHSEEHRCATRTVAPMCCHVVPTLYEGYFDTTKVDGVLQNLEKGGSEAAPGFMKPEGVVIFHVASYQLFKKTLDKNDEHKWRTT